MALLGGAVAAAPRALAEPAQAEAPSDVALAARLDALFARRFPATEPGAAVRVQRGDQVLLRKGYGLAQLAPAVPVSPDLVFRVGSVTKQFTAVLALQLVDEGRLSLDQSVRSVLPDYPAPQGDRVTVRHLLAHTSGIPSFTGLPDFATHALKDAPLAERLALFQDLPLASEPGTRWVYSNSGYVVLGAILERVTGQSYAELVRARIAEPLGLQHTRVGDQAEGPPVQAVGHERGPRGRFQLGPRISMDWPYAAGAITSTVDDLVTWSAALRDGALLSAASRQEAWTPGAVPGVPDTGYGLGWAVGTVAGRTVVHHAGGITGFAADLVTVPSEGIVVAVLSNGAAGDPLDAARRAVQLLLGAPYPEPEEPAVRPTLEELEAYAGVYRRRAGGLRVVEVRDGTLTTQRPGGPQVAPRPLGDGRFLFEDGLVELAFVPQPDGGMVQRVTSWGGAVDEAVRTNEPLPVPPPPIRLPAGALAPLVGTYALGAGPKVVVERRGARLFARVAGGRAVELTASSPTTFFQRQLGAALRFELGASGRAEAVVLQQGGRELRGARVEE